MDGVGFPLQVSFAIPPLLSCGLGGHGVLVLQLGVCKGLGTSKKCTGCGGKALQEVKNLGLGYYSRLFLVQKVLRSWRLVIDLSSLNNFMTLTILKMMVSFGSGLHQKGRCNVLNRFKRFLCPASYPGLPSDKNTTNTSLVKQEPSDKNNNERGRNLSPVVQPVLLEMILHHQME